MKIEALKRPLTIDEIDFRVQSVNNGGYATILAYKDARADMKRLDEAVGPLGWKREHSNNNANCTVSIWNPEINEWVSKEDTGTEANTEKEKSLASDSFKRSCFSWGIGRELYDYPVISVKLFGHEITEKNGKKTASWGLKLKEWTWFSQFDENGKLSYLAAKDENNKKRFVWGEFNPDLKEQKALGVKADSSPSEAPAVRGTTDEEEKGDVDGLLKKKVDSFDPAPTAEEVRLNELRQKYKIIFGKEAHHKMKAETIEAKIIEETEKKVAAQDAPQEEVEVEVEVEAEEVEVEAEEVDAYSTEAEDFDLGVFGGVMADEAAKVDSFEDKNKLKDWAIKVFKEWKGKAPEEHLTEFREIVNNKYESLM
jgi:hypothetical protein